MSNLESIVPPVELCKRIPAGEFEDSVMARYNFHGIPILRWRDNLEKLNGVRPIPAPTLAEILNALYKQDRYENKLKICPVFHGGEWSIGYSYQKVEKDFDLTAAALRLWFKVKGIEVKE